MTNSSSIPMSGNDRQRRLRPVDRVNARFWLLTAFLVFVAVTGGGSRPDILSLVILRPLAVAASAVALWSLSGKAVRDHRFAFILMTSAIILTGLHLVPLPPQLWQGLPGRALVADVDALTGIGAIWRPISLTPADTRNALFSLAVPLAVLAAGAPLNARHCQRLLIPLVLLGLGSALLALLQLVGPPTGPLFLYKHTNYGAATGLFANRNHQAILLAMMFPMLAALLASRAGTSQATRLTVGALAAAAFLVPLLLVTGSRAGFVLGALGLASVPWILRQPSGRSSSGGAGSHWFRRPRGLVIVGVAALVALTVFLSRAESLDRLFAVGANEELRFKVWPVIARQIGDYFPLGSGIGSFAAVFQIAEPDAILRPTYLNHAHNEILEVLLTAGLPGVVLMLTGIGGWIASLRTAAIGSIADDDVLFGRLGVVMIAILGLGSIGDYPLRTPFLMSVMMVAALWSGSMSQQSAKRRRRRAGSPESA